MADTVVNNNVAANTNLNGRGLFGPYYITPLIGAKVLQDAAGSCVVQRTIDGGATWAAAQLFTTGYISPVYSAIFEGQNPVTPTGTRIFVVASDNVGGAGASKFSFNSYDIATGLWGTVDDIKTDATFAAAGQNSAFISLTRAGGYWVGYNADGVTTLAWRSDDGATWVTAATPYEAANDTAVGMTGINTGNPKDAAVLYGDASSSLATAKMYSDALNTVTESGTALAAGIATDSSPISVSCRVSDGLNFAVLCTALDSATADTWLYSLNLNSIASPVLTQLGAVLTDSPETGNPAVWINQVTGVCTAVYSRGTAFGATQQIFSKTATDATGATFGLETAYSEDAEEDYRVVHAGAHLRYGGGRFQPCFFDDDDNDVFVNLTNDIEIAAVTDAITGAIAAGVICMWPSTHATIPTGWRRVVALDSAHPKGTADVTEPGVFGGAAVHTHASTTHGHTVGAHTHGSNPVTGAPAAAALKTTGLEPNPTGTHTHTVGTSTSDAATAANTVGTWDSPSSDPAFYGCIFIESDGTPDDFPLGALVWTQSATAPSGWQQHVASKDKFIKGAAQVGDGATTGGAATHPHAGVSHTHTAAHTHTVTTGAPSATVNALDGANVQPTATHTHLATFGTVSLTAMPSTTGNSSTDNHEPPYYRLQMLEALEAAIDEGLIAMWRGTLASIPTGWFLCDGTNGTPDLRGKFIKNVNSVVNIGDTGGSATHSHTGSAHTHDTAHTHNVTTGVESATDSLSQGTTDVSVVDGSHTHVASASASAAGTSGSGSQDAPSVDGQPTFYTVAFIMAGEDFAAGGGVASTGFFMSRRSGR